MEPSEVSGLFDGDIHRCPKEAIYTGNIFWDQDMQISMVSARKLTHKLKYFIPYGLKPHTFQGLVGLYVKS